MDPGKFSIHKCCSPSNWEVVHGDLPEDALAIDDEEASEGVAVVLQVDAVVLRDGVSQVAQDRDAQLAQASFAARNVGPTKEKNKTLVKLWQKWWHGG